MSIDATPHNGLGRAIELRRVQIGLKRKDLAIAAQLSYPYVSELEKGTKEPSAKALRQLADALQLGVSDLLALGEQYEESDASLITLPPFDPGRSLARIPAQQPAATTESLGQSRPQTAVESHDIDHAVRLAVDRAIADYEINVLPRLVRRLVDEALVDRENGEA
jgi:transcriptional regulator with XRE-family HTH domain